MSVSEVSEISAVVIAFPLGVRARKPPSDYPSQCRGGIEFREMVAAVRCRKQPFVLAATELGCACRRLLFQPAEDRRRRDIGCVCQFVGQMYGQAVVPGVAGDPQLDRDLTQAQCPEIPSRAEQSVRFVTDFFETTMGG